MKVVTLVVAVLAAVFVVAGVLVGWVAGSAAEWADQAVNTALEAANYKTADDAWHQWQSALSWVSVGHTLLVMGGLLAALAALGVVLLVKDPPAAKV